MPGHKAVPRWVVPAVLIAAASLAVASAPALASASDAPATAPERSPEALQAMQTMAFEGGTLSFTARNVGLKELFMALADVGRFSVEGIDLLPDDPVSVSYTEFREQDCLSQLLQQVPEINIIFLAKKQPAPGESRLDRIQLHAQDSTGISGSSTVYNPLEAAMGGDLFGSSGGVTFGGGDGGPTYIPPEKPPVYIPPDEPPVYIPPAEPPVYIPPTEPPRYIPPSGGGEDAAGGGEGGR